MLRWFQSIIVVRFEFGTNTGEVLSNIGQKSFSSTTLFIAWVGWFKLIIEIGRDKALTEPSEIPSNVHT